MRVKCLAQEHNTMSPARARTRTARSGVERTNHETTTPPTITRLLLNVSDSSLKSCSIGWVFSCSIGEKPFSAGLVGQPLLPASNQAETVEKVFVFRV